MENKEKRIKCTLYKREYEPIFCVDINANGRKYRGVGNLQSEAIEMCIEAIVNDCGVEPLERIPEETRHLPDDTNLFGKKVKVINQIEGFEKTINIGDMLLVKPLVYGQFELLKNKKRVMWGSNSTLIEMVNKGDMAVVGEEVKPPVEPILDENVSDRKVEPLQNGEREQRDC